MYLESIFSFHKQFQTAFKDVQNIELSDNRNDYDEIRDIVVAGMGGSAFGGRVIRSAFLDDKLSAPLDIAHRYELPNYADEKTLVICTSYSGNTEETVAIYKEAKSRGCPIICVSSDGKLAELSKIDNVPCYIFNPKDNPSKAPRTALGYNIGAVIGILSKLDLLDFSQKDADETYKYMESFIKLIEDDDRMPRQVAQKFLGRIPVFVSAEHLISASHIWRNFLNETSKHVGFVQEIPEMNHHFLDGLLYPKKNKDDLLFIYINSSLYSKQNKKRMKATRDVTRKYGISDISISLGANDKFNEIWELLIIGCTAAFHLAKIHGVNPSSNEMVDLLKSKL